MSGRSGTGRWTVSTNVWIQEVKLIQTKPLEGFRALAKGGFEVQRMDSACGTFH
jgi:hypothetical protein